MARRSGYGTGCAVRNSPPRSANPPSSTRRARNSMPETTTKSFAATPSRVVLRLPEPPTILHILASRVERDTVAGKLDKLAAGSRFALRSAGPGKWLALASDSEAPGLMTELREALGD